MGKINLLSITGSNVGERQADPSRSDVGRESRELVVSYEDVGKEREHSGMT